MSEPELDTADPAEAGEPVVDVAGLSVRIDDFLVFSDVDLIVPAGEIVAVLGDIGSGKTTLLKVLAGKQPAASGGVWVMGLPPDDPDLEPDVVLVAGDPEWESGASALQLVERARQAVDDVPDSFPSPRQVLETFALADRADDEPYTLSQGLRQRLALATAFARPSRLLLIDDPEFGLDPMFRPVLAEILADYAARGGTIVMGTHDLDLAVAAKARTFSID
jgi:ABC-type multidrug transport system ATPase subunit